MSAKLSVSVGQYSSAGRKEINQDFHGVYIPKGPELRSKGIAVAIADGISSSQVSQEASQTSVKSFFDDYYCTSDSWTVKASAERVLQATNSWLYSQSKRSPYRFDKDKGYVCTFSSIILKSTTAHIFHIGDARVYRLTGGVLESLTEEHRLWVSKETSYLSRALGINQRLEIDYQKMPIESGDTFVLVTDGIHEHVTDDFIINAIDHNSEDLDQAAKTIADQAFELGSADNLTIQIICIDELADGHADELYQQVSKLPFPPKLEARRQFDGYEIVRDIYSSSRSQVVLARDIETQTEVVIKTPSVDLRDDSAYLERFLIEEWIAKRLDSAHVLKPSPQTRKRNYFYIVTEFIDGQTLAQWMIDNPKPDVETVRNIVEQIAKGLQSFHRQEMLHQDLRPNNVMIDCSGTVKIIDFGSTMVAGLAEMEKPSEQNQILGTAQFTAPEYLLGEYGTRRSDLYSLAVIAYQMLSGKLPYGISVANARTQAAQNRLVYQSVLDAKREIPAWVDLTLKKALQPDPQKRYGELSEFIHDLRYPNSRFLNKTRAPLIEANPLLFWKGLSCGLLVIIVLLLLRS